MGLEPAVDTVHRPAEGDLPRTESGTRIAGMPRMKRVADYLVYLLVRIVFCVVQSVPISVCDRWAWALAWFATRVIPVRRNVIDENLRQAFPEWSAQRRRQVACQMWHHLVLMACEMVQVPRKVHETNWRRFVQLRDARQLTCTLLDQRPSVLISGHFGNFEVACYLLGLFGFPTFAVARPLDNRYLDRFVNRLRRATGQRILPKQGSADEVNRLLESRGTLALLGDQHAGPKGCWVDFFGRPASCHKAIALFALAHEAPLIVTYARRAAGPLQFAVGLAGAVDPRGAGPESRDVRWLTAWYNRRLEEIVREAPEQYWWVHRRWKGSPPQRASRAARSEAAA
jgi:Kdo2-lipid IVA lauroyltransferase/acyltransferase